MTIDPQVMSTLQTANLLAYLACTTMNGVSQAVMVPPLDSLQEIQDEW